MLSEREEGAGLQYSIGFGEEPRAIGHVHGDVLRVCPVERGVWIGQVLTVAKLDLHLVLHADERRQLVCCLNEGLRYVQAADIALKPLRQVAGGTTQSAADVENPLTGPYREAIRKLYGRR